MPARKRKRRRPPEPRQPRRVPTQNRLPSADSFNLKARSLLTWPFSLCHNVVSQAACPPNGGGQRASRPLRWVRRSASLRDCTASDSRKMLVIPRRLGRGTSHLVTRNGMFTPAPQSVALPETTTSAIGRARLCRARSHDEHIGGHF